MSHWRVFLLGLGMLAVLAVVFVVLASESRQRARDQATARLFICQQINERALDPLRGILQQAQTSAARNPLPPGLTPEQLEFYNHQRAMADQFYAEALAKTTPIDCRLVGGTK